MKCPICGSEVTGNFCEDCGAPAPKPQSSGIPSSPDEASWDPPPPSDGAPWNPPPAVQDTESAFQQFSGGSSTSGYRPPSLVRKLLLAAVFVILLLAGLFLIFSISRSASRQPAGSRQSDGWYSEGSYRVGKDLEPGLYYLSAGGGWLSADVDAPLFGGDDRYESFETFGYLELEDGETLELDGGRMIEADSAPLPQTENGWYGPGMYRVGRDLPAGEYLLTPNQDYSAHYEILDSSQGGYEHQLDSGWSDGELSFRVEEGQYLNLSFGTFRANP